MAAKKASPYFAAHYYKTAEEIPLVVKDCRMDDTMRRKAEDAARQQILNCADEKTMAGEIKHVFQQEYGGSWHCVVGRVFSSSVTAAARHYIYMYVGYEAILLFKTP